MLKRIVMFLSASSATAFAFAQAPVGQSPASPAASVRPAHNCVRPEQPGRLATNNQFKVFDKDEKAYRECLQTFVKAQAELVKLHAELGNSAVKEYNDYVTELKKKREEEAK
jgi:hypothetical protein